MRINKYQQISVKPNVLGRQEIHFSMEYEGIASKKQLVKYLSTKNCNARLIFMRKISKNFLKGFWHAYDSASLMDKYTLKS